MMASDAVPSVSTSGQSSDRLKERARLALALCVIRGRPAGQTGRGHAEALAAQLRAPGNPWRSRAQLLQEEVLQLRRELLLIKMSRSAGGADALPQEPQEPQGPQEPPPLYVAFLQGMCELSRTGQSGEAPSGAPDPPAGGGVAPEGSLLEESVCRLLSAVVAVAGGAASRPPPPSLLLQACETAARASQFCSAPRRTSPGFERRLEEQLGHLTHLLLHLDTVQEADVLVEAVVLLASSSLLRSFLLQHLLCLTHCMVQKLWTACQGEEPFEVHLYENSFYLLRLLEQVLQRSEVRGTPWRPEQQALWAQLERQVLPLSEEFPLLALYVWRVGALLPPRTFPYPPGPPAPLGPPCTTQDLLPH